MDGTTPPARLFCRIGCRGHPRNPSRHKPGPGPVRPAPQVSFAPGNGGLSMGSLRLGRITRSSLWTSVGCISSVRACLRSRCCDGSALVLGWMSLGRRGTEAGCLCHVAATGPLWLWVGCLWDGGEQRQDASATWLRRVRSGRGGRSGTDGLRGENGIEREGRRRKSRSTTCTN